MPTPQNENLQEMTNNVLQDFPLYEPSIIKRRINEAIRNLLARRPWSGLVKFGILQIPAVYTTGSIDLTFNSRTVSGNSTLWPTNDLTNTSLSAAVIETGYQDASATSMTGIEAGVWVVVGQGTANAEAVFIIAIDSAASTFRANFTKTHASLETILRSSLAGRQIRTGMFSPFFTITGVLTASSLLIDLPWGSATITQQGYSISLVYATLGQDVKMPLTMVNTQRNYQFSFNIPKAFLDWTDPQRTTTETSFICSFHSPDPAGAPLWEIYPRGTSQQSFPYYYLRQWLPLDNEFDILPNGLRSDVVCKYVRAEAYRWPKHRRLEDGIYFDPKMADTLLRECETDVQNMMLEDDNTSMMSLMWDYRKWPYAGFGADFWQNHDPDGFFGNV